MKNIFFSWQSDLDSKTHRNFIEKCIKKSLKALNKVDELHVFLEYDRDTLGLLGSPDISISIFEKIDKCALFIADISNITSTDKRTIPNPNVLIELGYAIHNLGWDSIICFFDITTGNVENLPFDIRQKRILSYNPSQENEEKRIISILCENILALYSQGKLANPLVDYMKGKIDKCFLDIGQKLCNILFETISLSEGVADINKLLNMTSHDVQTKLEHTMFPAFIFLDEHETTDKQLREILKDLFTSNYFSKDWPIAILNLIDWLRVYRNIVDPRDYNKFVEETGTTCSNQYAVISAYSINKTNPPNSKLVLEVFYKDDDLQKYVDPQRGKVINTLEYPDLSKNLEEIYRFKYEKIEYLTNHIYGFIKLFIHWLDITDSEFILDPDFFQVGHF